MLKVIVLDDSQCRKETDAFLKKHRQSIKTVIPVSYAIVQATQVAEKNSSPDDLPKKIAINTAEKVCLLDPFEIIHCEGSRNYTRFHLTRSRNIVLSKNLMEFEKQLARFKCFVRVHKSHLININHLEQYIKADGGYVVLSNNSKLPVASRKKEYLLGQLKKL